MNPPEVNHVEAEQMPVENNEDRLEALFRKYQQEKIAEIGSATQSLVESGEKKLMDTEFFNLSEDVVSQIRAEQNTDTKLEAKKQEIAQLGEETQRMLRAL